MRGLWLKNMKTVIDANVILRYILNDNEAISAEAKEIIDNKAETLVEVLAEVVYVLKGVYKAERTDICEYITCILHEVELNEKEVVIYALQIFSKSNLDFVDCLLVSKNHLLGRKIFSFDKKLNIQLK